MTFTAIQMRMKRLWVKMFFHWVMGLILCYLEDEYDLSDSYCNIMLILTFYLLTMDYYEYVTIYHLYNPSPLIGQPPGKNFH